MSGPSGNTDREMRAVAHHVLCRKAGPPRTQMQNPHTAMDRDGKAAAPLTGSVRDTDGYYFLFLSSK
jgi:hypothetical protein